MRPPICTHQESTTVNEYHDRYGPVNMDIGDGNVEIQAFRTWHWGWALNVDPLLDEDAGFEFAAFKSDTSWSAPVSFLSYRSVVRLALSLASTYPWSVASMISLSYRKIISGALNLSFRLAYLIPRNCTTWSPWFPLYLPTGVLQIFVVMFVEGRKLFKWVSGAVEKRWIEFFI